MARTPIKYINSENLIRSDLVIPVLISFRDMFMSGLCADFAAAFIL